MNISHGISTHPGKRPYQEDRFSNTNVNGGQFFAVYDGHGGDNVSSFLMDNLSQYFTQCLVNKNTKQAFECAFAKAETYSLDHYRDGSTAVVAYIDKNNVLHVAWVGDSRAVLECDNKVCLSTKDHKPNRPDEQKRIEKIGGYVLMMGVWRVNGLAVSRSIGDKELKSYGPKNQIIATPEYAQMQLKPNNHFLIVASDGLWDVIDNEKAIAMVNTELQAKKPLNNIAQMLQEAALAEGSQDNITVCVVKFDW